MGSAFVDAIPVFPVGALLKLKNLDPAHDPDCGDHCGVGVVISRKLGDRFPDTGTNITRDYYDVLVGDVIFTIGMIKPNRCTIVPDDPDSPEREFGFWSEYYSVELVPEGDE